MARPIATLAEVADARTFFEKRLQSGAYTEEKYNKQMAILDEIEARIRNS